MSIAANHTARAGQPGSVPSVQETRYLSCPRVQVVMVPQAGHYPQPQRPDITTGAVLRFLESVRGRA